MDSNLTIDLRMYRMSGIGRYLQTVIPELLPRLNASCIRVLGNVSELSREGWLDDERVQLCDYRASIFSVAEQLEGPSKCLRGGVLWVPQYNIPLFYRGKLVVTIHDLCQLAYPDTLGNDLQRWYARYLLKAVAKKSDAILCVSEFTRGEVERYLTVKRARLFVTHPGTGLDVSQPKSTRIRREHEPYLLAVGNLKKHKNLRRLISAFESVQSRIGHKLVIIGKKEGFLNSEPIPARATALLDGRVRFTGEVSDEELRDYYSGAGALIYPSLYEGFGFPVLEAMAQGCPVACSNVASLPEVVGNSAVLFDPFNVRDIAETIVTIVEDSALRQRLINRGFAQIARFSTCDCAEKTSEVLNSVLDGTTK